MVNLLILLINNVEENNKKNSKTQALTEKPLAACEEMSHCIDLVLLQMETIENKIVHQAKLIVKNDNHNKEKVIKISKDFIKATIPNNKTKNNDKENIENYINKPQDNHTQNEKQTKQVGNYCKELQTTPCIHHPLPAIPKFRKLNQFKLGYIPPRSKIGHRKPFENLSAHSVQTRRNQVLKDVNAKLYD
ncbi:hypothetical protein O181_083506 [Austropuccinia psidii MF-1]|uniref:Uncharacterized protein n=1 Tax=Austropuccinia psidii MF-1 TaxID=1389203 RepID=A0A9Q3IHX5_9BASI|nr:hypothetical protein [Austropuccinia psidii MF-1]